MSGDEVRVYPAALKRAGGGFEDGSAQLKSIFETLSAALSGEGRCWGADETGQQIEQGYLQPAQDTLKAGPAIAKNLGEITKGIDQMAKNYMAAEDSSTVK